MEVPHKKKRPFMRDLGLSEDKAPLNPVVKQFYPHESLFPLKCPWISHEMHNNDVVKPMPWTIPKSSPCLWFVFQLSPLMIGFWLGLPSPGPTLRIASTTWSETSWHHSMEISWGCAKHVLRLWLGYIYINRKKMFVLSHEAISWDIHIEPNLTWYFRVCLKVGDLPDVLQVNLRGHVDDKPWKKHGALRFFLI